MILITTVLIPIYILLWRITVTVAAPNPTPTTPLKPRFPGCTGPDGCCKANNFCHFFTDCCEGLYCQSTDLDGPIASCAPLPAPRPSLYCQKLGDKTLDGLTNEPSKCSGQEDCCEGGACVRYKYGPGMKGTNFQHCVPTKTCRQESQFCDLENGCCSPSMFCKIQWQWPVGNEQFIPVGTCSYN